ncbi:Sterol uptake control protein 2 [Cytospora mali]|uniref:Sterol uptake control protein 2 n=1 Tax=Cytospora mali TaxID=578113 RepID=A0A194WB43_CYTMA|nr:Sterol uptake control protein 2 [Valsa mali]
MAILDRDRDLDGHRSHHPSNPAKTPVPMAPEGKPYHAKRPHRKSRLGCRNCKTRRVKCDEAKPRCGSCTSRKETCNYPTLSNLPPQLPGSASASAPTSSSAAAAAAATFTPVSASAPAPASAFHSPTVPSGLATAPFSSSVSYGSPMSLRTAVSPAASSTSLLLAQTSSPAPSSSSRLGSYLDSPNSNGGNELIIVDEPPVRFAGADEYDMRLLWFYTTETYASVSIEAGRIPHVDGILRSQIVRFAFQSPFLMDCILGLSAMHMQSRNIMVPMSKALTYRGRAFSGYRKAVERAEPKDYPALLACSVLLCALSSELFREPDMKPLYIIDWMVVWRGIGLIIEVVPIEALFSSGLDKLFSRPAVNLNQTATGIPNNLLSMVTSIKQGDVDYYYIEAYYSVLKFLGGLYLELETGFSPVLSLRIITFFTFLPKPFIQLGRMHRPKALIIIAHYLTFLKMVENVWWLVGIADRGIQDIIQYLGPEWQYLLGVPRAAVGVDDKVELAKLIKGNHAWQPAEVGEIVLHPNPDSRKLTMVNNVGEEVTYDKQKGWVPLAKNVAQGGSSSSPWGYVSPPNT